MPSIKCVKLLSFPFNYTSLMKQCLIILLYFTTSEDEYHDPLDKQNHLVLARWK